MTVTWFSWLVAGSIASWLAYEVAGRGPVGLVADWVVGLLGSLLAVFLLAPPLTWLAAALTAQPRPGKPAAQDWWHSIETFHWWYGVPLAFLGGLLLTFIFRKIFRVRERPSS